MKEVIKNIINRNQIYEVFDYVINNLYTKGPVDGTDMEILSYLALYCPNEFEIYKDKILNYMGVFYSNSSRMIFSCFPDSLSTNLLKVKS